MLRGTYVQKETPASNATTPYYPKNGAAVRGKST